MKIPSIRLRQPDMTPPPPAMPKHRVQRKQMVWQPGQMRASRPFLHWWTHLTRTERIVTMSLAVGGFVAIVNSITWAIATSYMAHQKAQERLATSPVETAAILLDEAREREPAMR